LSRVQGLIAHVKSIYGMHLLFFISLLIVQPRNGGWVGDCILGVLPNKQLPGAYNHHEHTTSKHSSASINQKSTAHSKMSSIYEIPIELLDHILKFTDNPIAQMSVCRNFNDLATPIAYRGIQLRCQTKAVVPFDIHLLLQTLISRPALGAHVRSLCFDNCHGYWRPRRYVAAQPYIDHFSSFAAEATARGLPLAVQRDLKSPGGFVDDMFVLLLSYLPGLQVLHLENLDDVGIFMRHISWTAKQPSGLQSLHSLIIRHGISGCNVYLVPVFHLPALRVFSCYDAIMDCAISDTELSPGSSNVEQIVLEYSQWNDGPLATLISSSRALRRFTYLSEEPLKGVSGSFYVSFTWNALLKHAKHTLERLDILFPDENPTGPVGSPGLLRDFTQLTHVYATLTILLGLHNENNPTPLSTILPESLVFLAVWIDEDWGGMIAVPVLVQLLASRRDSVRQLKELCVGGDDIDDAELEAVRSVCLAEGVEFGKFENPFPRSSPIDTFPEVPCLHDI